MLNLINYLPVINKNVWYAKDPYKTKHHILINKREKTNLKCFNDSEALTQFSNDMNDICKNIKEYNANKKQNILLHLMIWLLSNKKLDPIAAKLFVRGRKLNISLVLIT